MTQTFAPQSDQAASRIEAAIAALKKGEMIVVTDDADREDEGDLFLAASLARPDQIAFMVRYTSGILCAPLPGDYAKRFQLGPMVSENSAPLSTPFTISVDYAPGLTTGISAEERCATVRALASSNASAEDFVRPGHIFPLRARDGGVLIRSGHTEAAVDMIAMAGLPPVGVLAELVNDDGTVKKGREVVSFAKEHNLALVSIAELIAYRQKREKLVKRIDQFERNFTPLGKAQVSIYQTIFDDQRQHLALLFGDPHSVDYVPARIHRENLATDVFGNSRPLDLIADAYKKHGCALLVYLRDGGIGVISESVESQMTSANQASLDSEKGREQIWKELGLGAQILRDMGITKIDLISSTPRKYVGLEGFGIHLK